MDTLQFFERPPENLFATPAHELEKLLGGPALVHVRGRDAPPLFVSVLLHGNETSGWQALCEVMSRLARADAQPRRSLILFIGNVAAAAEKVRSLPGQMDFNRIWRGEHGMTALASQVLERLAQTELFAALDIHNNTGRNPHYTVLTRIDSANVGLALLFSEKAVLVEEPDTVLTRAVQQFCPSTTVEVGPVGDPQSTARTVSLLEHYLTLERVPHADAADLQMHHALARVHILPGVSYDFADQVSPAQALQQDLVLTAGMEAVNFHPVAAGMEFGFSRRPLAQTLQVLDTQHRDVTAAFLNDNNGHITLARALVPAMYTTDKAVIAQDCLCYFMERI
ncbi:MAG: succinylglutamate desuccinylase/aspartoacylase family protein [bacterium]